MIPCATCGKPTDMIGTKRCNFCWELERRLPEYLARGGEKARSTVIDALADQDRARVVRRWTGRANYRKTVAIDFDGVIHHHVSKWTVPHEINDGPVVGALDFIEQVLLEFDVIIFSARANDPVAEAAIGVWLYEQWSAAGKDPAALGLIGITARKPHAFVYIDDCGWRFEGDFPSMEELRAIEPWTKKATT